MSLLNQSIIKHKMGLLNLAAELHNVSQACRVMGVSRDTGGADFDGHTGASAGMLLVSTILPVRP